MNRLSRLLVVALATLSVCGRDACVANVKFPFNADSEDWTWGTFPELSGTDATQWEWHKQPSSLDGALRALLFESGSATGAWAMSPCMVLNDSQGQINVDISHFTLFPGTIVGQVQYQITSGSTVGPWQGIPVANWLSDGSHIRPTTTQPVFPPLLSSSGTDYTTNAWAVFTGTYISSGTTGAHINSGFTLTYGGTGTDLGVGVQNGDEIVLRLVVGASDTTSGTGQVLWEVNEVQVDGVKLCKAVPEPSTIVLAGGAALIGLAAARRSRSRSSRRNGTSQGRTHHRSSSTATGIRAAGRRGSA